MKKSLFLALVIFLIGVSIGAYLFNKTYSRNILPLVSCKTNCYSEKELAGLITSVLIQKTPSVLPHIVAETDKAIAIKSPFPQSPIHYVIFPKKDIKNIAEVAPEDQEYLMDIYKIISQLVEKDNLVNYQVITNGPGYQHMSFLHFHLRADKRN